MHCEIITQALKKKWKPVFRQKLWSHQLRKFKWAEGPSTRNLCYKNTLKSDLHKVAACLLSTAE